MLPENSGRRRDLWRRRTGTVAGVMLLASLAGCGSHLPVPPASAPMVSATTAAPKATETSTPPLVPAATAIPTLDTYSGAQKAEEGHTFLASDAPPAWPTSPSPGLRAADTCLQFLPPMPSAAEVLEWRPPPVPVPHSLHPNDHYWLRRPIPSGRVDYGLDSYPYGGNGGGTWSLHHGMDFPNDLGTPVLAAADGSVVWVEQGWSPMYVSVETYEPSTSLGGPALGEGEEPAESAVTAEAEVARTLQLVGPYGNHVILKHDWGWNGEPVYTVYGHLLEVFVQAGDHVSAGDLLGGVGSTGNSTGPHLHFEVRTGSNGYEYTRNPALWIAPYEGWGNLAGLVCTGRGTAIPNVVLSVYPLLANGDIDRAEGRYVATYAGWEVNPDENWNENVVVPDLPAGDYRVMVWAGGEFLQAKVQIRAGVTSFVTLHTKAP